ncbi:hypothetical protein BRC83_02385 [Halobacteriales archaeon QS_1_68_17]|nr:MAG: hypothetical protein BRC83_02385 [Halobacteriales archaeon QS_1_68_17]
MYEVFVAEFFLTQTPAENVAAVYPQFLDRFPTLESIREAGEETVARVIEPLGFQNMRAAALTNIATEHRTLPDTVDELENLERVGPYVANATLCFAQDRRLPVVDRNVKRVYRRLLGTDWPEPSSDQWRVAANLVPPEAPRRYNLALLDFGAEICRSEPRCSVCFASPYCRYYSQSGSE